MMSASRVLSAMLVTAAILRGAALAYAADEMPHGSTPRRLPVTVCDFAGVDSAVRAGAEAVASEMYREAGVTIEWAESGCMAGPPPGFSVNFAAVDPGNAHVAELILGFAEPGGSTATVLYKQVERLAQRHHKKPQLILGYVIAHELGHLLLPPHSHSATGIMRPTLNLEGGAGALRVSFTMEQAELIARKIDDASTTVATH